MAGGRLRRPRLVAVVAGLALVTTAVLTGPAYAAGSPPAPVDDKVTIRAGEGELVDLGANDIDADGDRVQVCRVSGVPRALDVEIHDGEAAISAHRRAHGTYTFTYYACDTSYLTPATVTVKVRPPAPSLDITPTKKPRTYRIVNTYKNRAFHCVWRGLEATKDEGSMQVPPSSRRTVTVHEDTVEFDCNGGNQGYGFIFG